MSSGAVDRESVVDCAQTIQSYTLCPLDKAHRECKLKTKPTGTITLHLRQSFKEGKKTTSKMKIKDDEMREEV